MKKIIITINVIVAIVLLLCYVYQKLISNSTVHEKPDLQLLIAEYFFDDYEQIRFEDSEGFIWNTIPGSIWQSNDSLVKIPVEWVIDQEEFEKLDSVRFGIANASGSKMYYMSWGSPNSRVRTDFLIHKNGNIDTLLFDGFGCGTGIYLEGLANGDSALNTQLHPILNLIYHGYEFEKSIDSIPLIFESIFGDSVGIRFRLGTYSLPWSQYEPQMIESPIITVATNRLIESLDMKKLEQYKKSQVQYFQN